MPFSTGHLDAALVKLFCGRFIRREREFIE
jgi:hypothetical protein